MHTIARFETEVLVDQGCELAPLPFGNLVAWRSLATLQGINKRRSK